MRILSIETSCDETGISILEIKGKQKPIFKVLANSLNSQIKIHAPYGGVFPTLAKREHLKNLPILLERTLKKANLTLSPSPGKRGVDLIAVTSGPGLEPALWTGIVFAKELSQKYKIPIIPVNHMEGHILSVFAKDNPPSHKASAGQGNKFKIPKIKFPALSLLVSGGHTELVLMKDFRKYKIIGETLDDAAGEAYDKVARMLLLPYPGGPEISKLAEEERTSPRPSPYKGEGEIQIKLPRPMMYIKNFDFSFSGLKTAVLYLIRDLQKENPNVLKDKKIKMQIACEFENAVVETLVYKTKKAIEKYNVQTLIVAGGVSANKHLKKEMQKMVNTERPCLQILFPDKKLSGDNSIMIGIAGYFKFIKNNKKTIKVKNIKAEGGLRL